MQVRTQPRRRHGGGTRHLGRKLVVSLVVGLSVTSTMSLSTAGGTAHAAAPAISSVTIDGATLRVDATDAPRGGNQLIAYTPTGAQTVTPTNVWGVEVVVEDGLVSSINDRLVSRSAGTSIPSDGTVLSGHGTARDWLLAHAAVGRPVGLQGSLTAPSGNADAPDPATVSAVTVDGANRVIDGTNSYRGADQLIRYTAGQGRTVTPTNTYGAEVVVVSGLVSSINDRQRTGGSATTIPANGYVLSGHGAARSWLLTHARQGLAVALSSGSQSSPDPLPVAPAPVVPPTSGSTGHLPGTGSWLSGQSQTDSVRDGSFAAWRGRPLDIGGTWAASDTPQRQIASAGWSIAPGNAYANIPAMDYAVGGPLNGETWAQAAAGQFDARWAEQLRVMKAAWGTRSASDMYIRFAHEMNGNWGSWFVRPGEVSDFVTAWRRYYALVQVNFPGAKLVWCPNAGTMWNYDVRDLWPGDRYVDVVGVDAYNRDPWVNDAKSFTDKINAVNRDGSPLGIESWRTFAQSHGKPLAVPEWASASVQNGGGGGDAPVFMQLFHEWLSQHGGSSAGNVLYEVFFNAPGYGDHYEIFQNGQPSPFEPQAAAMYRSLW